MAMVGLGLRGAEDNAPAAYATSVLASQPLALSFLGRHQQGKDPDTTQVLPSQAVDAMSVVQGEEAKEEDLAGLTQRHISVKVDLHQ